MDGSTPYSFSEFEAALTPQRIRTFQIIAGALLAGTTVFLAVVLLVYAQTPEKAPPDSADSILPILTGVHAVVAGLNVIAAIFVYRFCISPKGAAFLQQQSAVRGDLQVPVMGAIFTGFIFSAALLEGAALFGIIVCLMGILEGTIRQEPGYWLNLFSYVIFAAFMVKTFPTRMRLENVFRERFMQGEM